MKTINNVGADFLGFLAPSISHAACVNIKPTDAGNHPFSFKLSIANRKIFKVIGFTDAKIFIDSFYRYLNGEYEDGFILFKILDRKTTKKEIKEIASEENLTELILTNQYCELRALKMRLRAEGIEIDESNSLELLEKI